MSATRTLSRRDQLLNHLKNLVYGVFPFFNGLYDACVMATGAHDYAKKQYSSKAAQIIFIVPVSIFSFFQSIGLNYKSTIENIDETIVTVRARKLPKHWIHLSHSQENLAIFLSAFILISTVIGDYCGGDYFVKELPDDFGINDSVDLDAWKVLAALTGFVASITTIFTAGVATYENVRNIIGRDKTPYTTTWLSFILGYILVTLAALEAAAETYSGVKQTIPYSSNIVFKYVLLIPSFATILSDFFFFGKITLSALDDFSNDMKDIMRHTYEHYSGIRYLVDGIWGARAEFCALAVCSLGASIWVEYPQRALTDDLLVDEDTSLPFDVPNAMRQLLGWGATLRDGILQIATLYPLFLWMMYKMFFCRSPEEELTLLPIEPIGLSPLDEDGYIIEEAKIDSEADLAARDELVVPSNQKTTTSLMKGTLTFWRAKLLHAHVGVATPLNELQQHFLPRFRI
jgi:hypothetical protein